MDRVQAAAYLPDNASSSTSEDNGEKSPKGKNKKFVILPQNRESIRTWGALKKQQKDFSVHILLQEEMTEKDIHDIVIKTFFEEKSIDLREASFDFVTMDKDGHEYDCACKLHCKFGKYVHQENHKPAEWNTKNIRKAAKGNRDVYIRQMNCGRTTPKSAYNSLSAASSTATSAMSLSQSNSEDNQNCTRDAPDSTFSSEPSTATSAMSLPQQNIEDNQNCVRDTPKSAYNSMSTESSTATSALGLSQSNSEDNQSFKQAGSPANSQFAQARKRLRKSQSEDSVSFDEHGGKRSRVKETQHFSMLDNCTKDAADSAYSSEPSTATCAISLPQQNIEDNQLVPIDILEVMEAHWEGHPGLFDAQLNLEQEGTSNSMMTGTLQQTTEMMKPVVSKVTDITPEKGDIAGGDKFVMTVNGCLPEREGLFVRFGESGGMDQVFPISPCSIKGKVPPGSDTGIVMASLYANLGGNLLLVGAIPYEYTEKGKENNENDPAYVERLLEKLLIDEKEAEKWLMFIAIRIGRWDWKPKKGTSAKDKKQCENDRTEALSLLRKIVETAAKINAMKFFTIIFSTPVAHSVFKCFKDEQVRLEEVARANGNEELACFLEEKHEMYQPDESDSDDEVDWRALSKVAAEYRRRNAGSIETGVVRDATSSESSQSYYGDPETSSSSLDSSDLQSNIGDHLEEAVEEPDTTSNSNSEEIKLDSDEQTVESESRQQEEEPLLNDLIGAPMKQLSLPVSVEEEAYEESDGPDSPPPYSAPASHAEEAYHLCAQEISQQAGSISDLSQGHQDQAVTTFGPAPRKQLSLPVSVEEEDYEYSGEPEPSPPYSAPACCPPQVANQFCAQESQQSMASITDSGQGRLEQTVPTFGPAVMSPVQESLSKPKALLSPQHETQVPSQVEGHNEANKLVTCILSQVEEKDDTPNNVITPDPRVPSQVEDKNASDSKDDAKFPIQEEKVESIDSCASDDNNDDVFVGKGNQTFVSLINDGYSLETGQIDLQKADEEEEEIKSNDLIGGPSWMEHTPGQLNYFRICYIGFNLVPRGLREVFKQEWDFRYKTLPAGEWQDDAQNGQDFYNKESKKSRSTNARNLTTIRNGNSAEWDCSCLFFAILFSDSIGTSLSTAIRKDVDDLRQVRNDIAHISVDELTDAEFHGYVGRLVNAFTSLGLQTSDIDSIGKQTNFQASEVNNLESEIEGLTREEAQENLHAARKEVDPVQNFWRDLAEIGEIPARLTRSWRD